MGFKKKIKADRTTGQKYWLLYGLTEGSEFRVIGFSKEEYEKLVENTYFDYRPGDYIKRVYPAFALLVREVKGHDFVIDQINGEYRACGTEIMFVRK